VVRKQPLWWRNYKSIGNYKNDPIWLYFLSGKIIKKEKFKEIAAGQNSITKMVHSQKERHFWILVLNTHIGIMVTGIYDNRGN
jgi:hypothetical protein